MRTGAVFVTVVIGKSSSQNPELIIGEVGFVRYASGSYSRTSTPHARTEILRTTPKCLAKTDGDIDSDIFHEKKGIWSSGHRYNVVIIFIRPVILRVHICVTRRVTCNGTCSFRDPQSGCHTPESYPVDS